MLVSPLVINLMCQTSREPKVTRIPIISIEIQVEQLLSNLKLVKNPASPVHKIISMIIADLLHDFFSLISSIGKSSSSLGRKTEMFK